MSRTLVYEQLRIVDPARSLDVIGHLVIGEGKIIAAGEGPAPQEFAEGTAVERRDGKGLCAIPGLFDLRAHLREPGYEDRETIASGCSAAAAGGYTDITSMPNTRPCVDTPGAVMLVIDRARAHGACRVHPAGALTREMEGATMVEYADLVAAGAVAFTDDLNWVRDSGLMRHSMEYCSLLGVPVISHPEDGTLTRHGVMHEGTWSTRLGLAGLPAAAEVSALARDIELARLTGAHLHLPHVSCRASVQLIRAAKQQGLRVTAETTPHHVYFTDADCRDYETNFKMKPPLRSQDDQDALVEALSDGTLDAIASDHAPHTGTDKDRTFPHAPFGVIGLETAFAAAHDRLVKRGPLSLLRLVELMSTAPARILGKPGGNLQPGGPADFALIDLEEAWTPRAQALWSKGSNCPFVGRELTGRVHATLLGGEPTFELETSVRSAEV